MPNGPPSHKWKNYITTPFYILTLANLETFLSYRHKRKEEQFQFRHCNRLFSASHGSILAIHIIYHTLVWVNRSQRLHISNVNKQANNVVVCFYLCVLDIPSKATTAVSKQAHTIRTFLPKNLRPNDIECEDTEFLIPPTPLQQ